MARLRLSAVLMLLAAFVVTATASDALSEEKAIKGTVSEKSTNSVSEQKKPVVTERKFDLPPLDFKSRSDFNVGDPASIPSGRAENLTLQPKNQSFFGLGFSRPFGGTK